MLMGNRIRFKGDVQLVILSFSARTFDHTEVRRALRNSHEIPNVLFSQLNRNDLLTEIIGNKFNQLGQIGIRTDLNVV